MTEKTWFETCTRPVGHLTGTITVTALAVVCAVVSWIRPEWQPTLVLIGATPLIIWATAMAVVFFRNPGTEGPG